jgi:hypothetical protein
MGVEAHFCAGRPTSALDPELEGPVATDAEFVFALESGKKPFYTLTVFQQK